MASTKVQRVMTQPINLIFRFLQSKARIQIWLFEQKDLRIEGRIIVSFSLSREIYWGFLIHDFSYWQQGTMFFIWVSRVSDI
uniref:Small nuclear ribonucleoprotein E-like n=1 Tax=Rhizophora mucronata TaxID=61149 RepID=A0A2P2JL35_RHIMU